MMSNGKSWWTTRIRYIGLDHEVLLVAHVLAPSFTRDAARISDLYLFI